MTYKRSFPRYVVHSRDEDQYITFTCKVLFVVLYLNALNNFKIREITITGPRITFCH